MQGFPSVKDNLGTYIEAGFPILYINTFEESKVDAYITKAAGRREILEWNGAGGFVDFVNKKPRISENQSLESTLSFLNVGKTLNRKLLVLKDAAGQLNSSKADMPESNRTVSLLKEIARRIRKGEIETTVIIVSMLLNIPRELEKYVTVLGLDLPDGEEIRRIVENFISSNDLPAVNSDLLDEMSAAFKGLSEFEIEDLISLAISKDGELTKKSLQLIFDQKKQMILKSGILEMIPLKESIDDIGGLENLKGWLKKKAAVFRDIKKAADFGVPTPKGVLIAGVAGCGKSLSAKAAGKLFDVPLLRLDMGRLMGKYVGESEENMRKAIQLVEAMSPCVLWVDELEKAFAGISSGGGGSEVTTRLFGAFLTWMQEKKEPAFVVATANDITKLPPELLRKGRFDEIFYVSLPNEEERKKIFDIHIRKRRKGDAQQIDLDALVSKTDGYSGADIESVVGESIESVFVKGKMCLQTEDILECIRNTSSLSEIMGEQITQLKKTYEKNKFKKASR